jgi:glycosidase
VTNSSVGDNDKIQSTSRYKEFLLSTRLRNRFKLKDIQILPELSVQENMILTLEITNKLNEKIGEETSEPVFVKASEFNAIFMMEKVTHHIIDTYRNVYEPDLFANLISELENEVGGSDELDIALIEFINEFPPHSLVMKESSSKEFLESETNGIPNREIIIQSMIVKMLNHQNNAFSDLLDMFEENEILRKPNFVTLEGQVFDYLQSKTQFKSRELSLFDLIKQPFTMSTDIEGQLEFIINSWESLTGNLQSQILASIDFLKEEHKARLQGPGPQEVYHYDGFDPEHFSPDKDWMANLVLLAKNTFVWFSQLSEKYGITIDKLDLIPDEELQIIAERGFSGIWLIGVWERSKASQTIKQWYGNPEAKGSAYSLFDYEISSELGGIESLVKLKEKASKHNIRLASDMVPNHTGIDSRWIQEHPEWFVSIPHLPFPSYTFNGESLLENENVGVFLEDHYFDHSDAAVVFKRVDYKSRESQYIYHGNDGTSMPWNDTAQLNFLNPEVREQVIQKILYVASLFPIIRFDAAMTLTKLHFQRLWYPVPGSGGDIPSRSQFGLTQSEFNMDFDKEFWREVVDRIAQEQPDTLLLAEAFWLMEGYFVRTLGMHRVYNSAFMHMLKEEDNAKYRSVIKNTLEFNPKILYRFVNYLTNPDEDTAITQFGDGDKYFGICTMMLTLPGLPMFGHGQYEGYSEKYGMEYAKAYWKELDNEYLIDRHDKESSYLMNNRYVFSSIENFLLYDFYTSDGFVNEDVFCYSNRHENERGLIVFNNKYNETAGWILSSVAYRDLDSDNLNQKNLGEGLNLTNKENYFCLFRDHLTDSIFIRRSTDLSTKGLHIELAAFKYHVFVDFKELFDDSGELEKIFINAQSKKIQEPIDFEKYKQSKSN